MILEVALLGLLLFIVYRYTRPPQGLPPGDWGFPLIGCIPKPTLGEFFNNLRLKHGPIFHVKLGSRIFIIISDYELVKTAFNNQDFAGRPDLFSIKSFYFGGNYGLIFSKNEAWQNERRFAIRHLRDFGMGKSHLEDKISIEAEALVAELAKDAGKPVELSWAVNVAVLNVIWGMVASRRYDMNDPEIQQFSKMISGDLDIMQGPVMLLDLMPWLVPLVPKFIKNSWMKFNVLEKSRDDFHEFVTKIILEHKSSLDAENPRDYIDSYIIESEREGQTLSTRKDHFDLASSVADLFAAGSETTSTTLRWVILYMALYPEIQKRIQKDIDDVVPRERMPLLQDRDKLTYFEATLMEVNRKASFVPLGVQHSAFVDTKLDRYSIPKGAIVSAYNLAIHNDPTYWEKPDEFYPEHFLDQEGKLITKKDGYLPFSVGRRQCLGESLAKMELFLFSAALLQKFSISAPAGVTLTTDTDPLKPFFNHVLPYKVVLSKR